MSRLMSRKQYNIHRVYETMSHIYPVRMSVLQQQANIFMSPVWPYLNSAIQPREIEFALQTGNLVAPHPRYSGQNPDNVSIFRDFGEVRYRQWHVGRIAYLVQNPSLDPLCLNVGDPELGSQPNWLVEDGNHRLAAKMYRKDTEAACAIIGSHHAAKNMGLMHREFVQDTVSMMSALEDDIHNVFVVRGADRTIMEILPMLDDKTVIVPRGTYYDTQDMHSYIDERKYFLGSVSGENVSFQTLKETTVLPQTNFDVLSRREDMLKAILSHKEKISIRTPTPRSVESTVRKQNSFSSSGLSLDL